jgi:hypothetical protein
MIVAHPETLKITNSKQAVLSVENLISPPPYYFLYIATVILTSYSQTRKISTKKFVYIPTTFTQDAKTRKGM